MASTAPGQAHEPHADFEAALRRVLRALVFRDPPESPLNELPLTQLRCLHCLNEAEGPRMHDLSVRLGVKLPALSQSVDRLARRGLVERRPDPDDRRVVRLFLTEDSRVLLAEVHAAHRSRMAAVAGRLEAGAYDRVVDGLRALAEAAEAQERDERDAARGVPEPDPVAELISRRGRARAAAALDLSPEAPAGRQ